MESMPWTDTSLSLALNLKPYSDPKGELEEELSRASSENRRLTEMLTAMYHNYSALKLQFDELMHRANSAATKRKTPEIGEGAQTDQSSSSGDDDSNVIKKPRETSCGGMVKRKPSSTVLVRTDKSDTSLTVKDGYQWRKYGQKVTRDNPSPRAYFKCSFAPTCQVKKKVQRSAEDQTMLVATYDGEHNHLPLSEIEASSQRSSSNLSPARVSPSNNHRMTFDLVKPVGETRLNGTCSGGPVLQQFIVEQMASSLSNDPGFKAAMVAAISGRMKDSNSNFIAGKWL